MKSGFVELCLVSYSFASPGPRWLKAGQVCRAASVAHCLAPPRGPPLRRSDIAAYAILRTTRNY